MRHAILTLPDLGIEGDSIRLTLWLIGPGTRVSAGDPVAEVLCGPATVDLPAPTDGILREILVEENELIQVGQPLARFEPAERP